ncbi:MAG: leucyl aminopeptidase family protein [Candidatus Eiseniibacteriota bacterium]
MPAFRSHASLSDPSVGADLLVVPVSTARSDLHGTLVRIGKGVADAAVRALDLGDFSPEEGTRIVLHSRGQERFPRCLLLGVGDAASRSPVSVRRAFAAAAREPLFRRVERIAVYCGDALGEGAELVQGTAAAVDGLLDGAYRWSAATEKPPTAPGQYVFLADGERDRRRVDLGIENGRIVGQAVSAAKDIANEPANRLSPAELAERAVAAAERAGLRSRVLDVEELERERCHALLTVGAGSSRPPRLVVLEHGTRRRSAPVVLVGKGLVFDTGGLNIKPGDSMGEMKFDKCGAAVVIATVAAAAELGLSVPVVGIVAAAENSISGDAYRPGDVIPSRSGKTIEVLNTDAEGRIVLADALDWAVTQYRPAAIIDVATLTGSAFFALGDRACAVLGSDDALIGRVLEAGARTGERAWQLPLWAEHLEDVKTPNADVRNTGPFGGGAIAGAAFLRAFVGDVPWAHLDVANVSRDRRNPQNGATGFGVRLLVELLRRWPEQRTRPRSKRQRRPRGKRRRSQ